jgi:Uma2 family endonuclease
MGSMNELMEQVRHRVTVSEYYKMAEVGIFGEDDRVELINGEILDMAPTGSHHGSVVKMLTHLFSASVGAYATVSVQDPLHLDFRSEPEPDLMLLKPRDDFYAAAHPGPSDVLLLVEVGDSTARFDREVKLPLYAKHGITEVWLINIETRHIEVCRIPQIDNNDYAERTIASAGLISPSALPNCRLEIEKLFAW